MSRSPCAGLSFLAFCGSLFFVSNCTKEKDKDKSISTVVIQPQLLRIQAENFAAPVNTSGLSLTALGATRTTVVDIKSLKYPIGSIGISGEPPAGQTASASGNDAFAIYECEANSNDGCLVELTGEALTNLLANAPTREARVGTYSQVNIGPCFKDGKSEDVRVKLTAEAIIDGVVYYTNAASGLSVTGPAEEVTFSPRSGCNSARFLTKNIIITEDSFLTKERPVEGEDAKEAVTSGELKEQLDLKLYFDLANAVIAAGPSSDPNASMETASGDFCKGLTSRVNPYVCLNFPEIVGTVDSGTPTLTRMLINTSTIWGFYSNSDGVPFGAYQRGYYNGFYNSSNEPGFLVGSFFSRFQVNADKSISFQQYDDGQNRHLKVSNFLLSDHSGTMTRGASETIDYTAVKL